MIGTVVYPVLYKSYINTKILYKLDIKQSLNEIANKMRV